MENEIDYQDKKSKGKFGRGVWIFSLLLAFGCGLFSISHSTRVLVCQITRYWVCIAIRDDAWELVPTGVSSSWYRILKGDENLKQELSPQPKKNPNSQPSQQF